MIVVTAVFNLYAGGSQRNELGERLMWMVYQPISQRILGQSKLSALQKRLTVKIDGTFLPQIFDNIPMNG